MFPHPLKTNVNASISPAICVHILCAPLAAIVIKPDAICFNLYMFESVFVHD